jgi:hypothetical protein
LLQEIKCYEDALKLYETVESNRNQLEMELEAAQAHARQAMREVQNVEDQLFEADRQAGKARTIIKECGFADVFRRKNSIIKITESNCSSFSVFIVPGCSHWHHTGRHFASVPAGGLNFSVVLD